MQKDIDILAIGEAMIEFNQRSAGADSYVVGFGGDTSNCAIAAARMGAKTAYLSRVGSDVFGQRLMALWADEGVSAKGVIVEEGADTGLYFVNHDDDGHHFSYRRKNSAASHLAPADISEDLLSSSRWLHFSGISQAISASAAEAVSHAMVLAKKHGTRISYDLNFRPGLWSADAALQAAIGALKVCDVFFPSVDEVRLLTGLHSATDIIHWAHAGGAKLVALKLGADGCLVSSGDKQTHIPSIQVDCVDATGAGDCFAGAFLSRLCAGQDPAGAAAFANAAAALSTQGYGAVAPLPRKDDVADWPERAR
jgi:2-dehydro-3-deoxygluconokinase